MLVYDEKVPGHFWRNAILTGVSLSRDSEIRGAIVEIGKTNTIIKRSIYILLTTEITYNFTNQTDKAREQS